MATLLTEFCNVYGAETGGAKRALGGLVSASQVDRQWYCPNPAVHRFTMVCGHGHKGQVMPLCQQHYNQYSKGVTFCPRCNIPPNDHRCQLRLEAIS